MDQTYSSTPMEKAKVSALDFFMYLGSIVLLYTVVGTLISFVFDLIDYLLPDRLTDRSYYSSFYSSGVRFDIAMLIVLTPALIALIMFINRGIRANMAKMELWVRKWSTFLTLFIGTGIVLGDLVTLINTFLNGEITARFIYKVLSVLIIASFITAYYILDLRGVIARSKKIAVSFGLVGTIIILGLLIGGLIIVGSPKKQRLMAFDLQKISHLQQIQYSVLDSYRQKKVLPANIEGLNDPLNSTVIPKDPQTNENYTYKTTSDLSFELCANFNLDSDNRAYPAGGTPPAISTRYDSYYYVGNESDTYWQHKSGLQCFSRTIDPDKYKPYQ